MTSEADLADPIMTFEALGPGRWRLDADPKWCNPGGGLWGGYDIGVAIGVLKQEPTAVGEALSLTLTYAYALPPGQLIVRTLTQRDDAEAQAAIAAEVKAICARFPVPGLPLSPTARAA